MKSVSLLALIASTAFALGQLKDASDYLNEPEKYAGKKIVLPCAYVGRASGPSEDPQYVMFGAVTATKGANSKRGGIKVAVPASEASAFLKEYGLAPDYDQIWCERRLGCDTAGIGRSGFDPKNSCTLETSGRFLCPVLQLLVAVAMSEQI